MVSTFLSPNCQKYKKKAMAELRTVTKEQDPWKNRDRFRSEV
jgi:hypothetical protein